MLKAIIAGFAITSAILVGAGRVHPDGFQQPVQMRALHGPAARAAAEQLKPHPVQLAPTPLHKHAHKMRNHTNARGTKHTIFSWRNLTAAHKHRVCLPKKGLFLQAAAKEVPVHIAKPGAGAAQDLADNGRSTNGAVNGEEVMMKAFKDGYSLVGCFKDDMPESSDKFGDNKDQYKGHNDVSIAVYKEHILKEEQKPMTPEVCFDFCRTIPQMGYFGISNGDYCYCEPYYHKAESGTEHCDQPCAGDPSQMCGGKTKSSNFEMHLCNDAADDLENAAEAAGNALVNMYGQMWAIQWRGDGLTSSGHELQVIAGLGGDPVAADWGQVAKVQGGDMEHLLYDGVCFSAYKALHKVYYEAQPIMDMDFFVAANLEKADSATADMARLSKVVSECRERAKKVVTSSVPWVKEEAASRYTDGRWDRKKASAWNGKHVDEMRTVSQFYYPLAYAWNPKSESSKAMSVCGGDLIGYPRPMKLSQCALACEETVYPSKCIGYQHFNFGGNWKSGWHSPLCFLLSKFTSLTTYPDCAFMKKKQPRKWTERWQRTVKPGPEAECDKVALYVFSVGTTCEQAYGQNSPVIKKCDEVCSKAKGTMISATCDVSFAWLSGFKPDIEVKSNDGCFGGDENKFVDDHEYYYPADEPAADGFGTDGMVSPWRGNDGTTSRRRRRGLWTSYDYYYYY